MGKTREEIDCLAWATIDQLPQYPVQSAGLAQSGRPKSFPEFEELMRRGQRFEWALSMFLHEFYGHRHPSFFEEPPPAQMSDINRVALAGTAEYLCHRYGYEVPSWTEKPEFFLESERNWFADWEASDPEEVALKEVLTPEFAASIREEPLYRSAPEFLRRNLYFPVRGLISI